MHDQLTTPNLARKRRRGLRRALVATGGLIAGLALPGAAPAAFNPVVSPTAYVATSAVRLVDTRTGGVTVDGLTQAIGIRVANGVTPFFVNGRGAIPGSASAVSLNVVSIGSTAAGVLTVYPCNAPKPSFVTTLSYAKGKTVANGVVIKLPSDGRLCIQVTGATHVIVDAVGYQPAGGHFRGVTQARVLETRTTAGLGTVDGVSQGIGQRTAGSTTEIVVAGRAGVASNAAAVALNLSVVPGNSAGTATVYTCGTTRPQPTLSHPSGTTVANSALVRLSATGTVCVWVSAAANVQLDVSGWFDPDDPGFAAVTPVRLMETRTTAGMTTVDGLFQGGGNRNAGTVTELVVAGRGGVPSAARAAVLNVLSIPGQGGDLTVYPCGTPRPSGPTLNYARNVATANTVVATIGTAGKVCIHNSSATGLSVEVSAAFTSTYPSAFITEHMAWLASAVPAGYGTDSSIKAISPNGRYALMLGYFEQVDDFDGHLMIVDRDTQTVRISEPFGVGIRGLEGILGNQFSWVRVDDDGTVVGKMHRFLWISLWRPTSPALSSLSSPCETTYSAYYVALPVTIGQGAFDDTYCRLTDGALFTGADKASQDGRFVVTSTSMINVASGSATPLGTTGYNFFFAGRGCAFTSVWVADDGSAQRRDNCQTQHTIAVRSSSGAESSETYTPVGTQFAMAHNGLGFVHGEGSIVSLVTLATTTYAAGVGCAPAIGGTIVWTTSGCVPVDNGAGD